MRQTLEQLDLNYFIPCQIRDHAVAVLGLGKTVDGDFLSSEDVELLFTIAGYLAIALDNAQLYSSLEQKAVQIERLKDFSENIVESLNVGVLAVDFDGAVESWNTQLERLIGVPREEAVGRKLEDVLPSDLMAEITARAGDERVSSLYKFHMQNRRGAQPGGQRFDRAAGRKIRGPHRAADPVRRHHAADAPRRADGPDRETHFARLAGRGRRPRSEYAARRDLQLHSDAGEAACPAAIRASS